MPAPQDAPRGEEVKLSDGTVAVLVEQEDGWALQVEGVRQSHVGPAGEPAASAYVRWMLAAVGSATRSCLHLGGGLLTLPRAVAEQLPGCAQVVVESEPALAALVRQRFGLPDGVTLEVGDGRARLEAAASGVDAVLVDVYAGGRIPPAFSSLEFFQHARRVLTAHGLLVVNSVAGPDLTFTRRELATLRVVFPHVAMIVQGSALQGLRFGNAVLLASAAPLPLDEIREALADDPSRGALVTDLDPLVAGAEPVRDADALWSPVPALPDFSAALRLVDALRETVETARDGAARAAGD